jgi:hypothetical protein
MQPWYLRCFALSCKLYLKYLVREIILRYIISSIASGIFIVECSAFPHLSFNIIVSVSAFKMRGRAGKNL